MLFVKRGKRLFYVLIISVLLASCTGVKYLEQGEKLLYNQEIAGVKKANKNDIADQILLEPNTRFPIIGPIGAYIYETGERAFDSAKVAREKEEFIEEIDARIEERQANGKSTKKLEAKKNRKVDRYNKELRLGNGRMRTGSPLAVYDSALIEQSAVRIRNYLMSKGFRKSAVTIETKEKGRKITQTFRIKEGKRSFIDSLMLRTGDTTITRIITEAKANSHLKVGEYYDRANMEKEQDRLDLLLRNNGYFEFNKRFIEFVVEYAPKSEDLWITTIINKPANRDFHKQFKIDSIVFNTSGNEEILDAMNYLGIKYNFSDIYFSPKVLDTRLKLEPNQLYRYSDVVNTQRQLLNMDIFRFANVNFDTTLVQDKFVANIYTAPLQRYQLTQELGVNVTEGTFGPFYNLSLRNRNTFGGAEILQFNGFIGSDGVSSATEQEGTFSISNLQYGANVSLTFPRFVTPFNSRELSRRSFNAKSSLVLGYSFINRPEYSRQNLNGSYGYSWQNEKGNISYRLNVSEINLVNTSRIDSAFQKQLDDLELQGNTLAQAFNKSFVSATNFNAIFNNNYGNTEKPSDYLRVFLEAGGTIYNLIGTGLLESDSLTYFKFGKAQLDYRKYIPLGEDKSLHWRVNVGYALPYGEEKALPYERYFFTGGSNSNRAWFPRRLGPGSAHPYKLDEDGNNEIIDGQLVPLRTGRESYRFEQPGEILLELSLEYRGNITSFIDWAFFIDAGNVWRFQEFASDDPSQVQRLSTGGAFSFSDFYKEIAIGAGLGLRFDFNFLVFRFDAGHKIKDPRFPEGLRWQMPFSRSRQGQTVWNIAVGYPF
ncbi:BamA/TamA family outer membrane protein [Roseivirga sp. UBA1976]|uniref:translocation and assembly module lipoprotein TamL n=1 Tax=Roseivirga sp. UBA1976 TaxID=1947386 RepID=UPI00257A3887|nr:BamA/TamA family outer membrane protein [Roseivirga sp. UBA1976]MEC7754826.1 BamA/TamA family outer membrane protein [Bacteroidota bacterium]